MSSPAADLAGFLATKGIGTPGVDLFVGRSPDGNSLAVTLYDMGGVAPNPKWARDQVNVQIKVNGAVNDYAGAYTKALEIKEYLLGLAPQEVPITIDEETEEVLTKKIYAGFLMRSDLSFAGYDAENRPTFMMNFRVIIDLPDTGNRLSL